MSSAKRNVLEVLEEVRKGVRMRVASGDCASRDVIDQARLAAALQAAGTGEGRAHDLAIRFVQSQREMVRVTFEVIREVER